MLGTYGRQAGFQPAITPVLDQFAAEASLFETAYAQVPTCGASRASLMTRLTPPLPKPSPPSPS